MKFIIVATMLALSSLSAQADIRIPVKTIHTFAITSASKLVLSGSMGVFDVPVTACSIETIENMEQPNIYFTRPYVKTDTTVIVYDQANRKDTVRCNIENVIERDHVILASR
jgi:hypothetical protein